MQISLIIIILHFFLPSECPIGEVDDYRIEVLVKLRKLERLDKDQFTEDERGDAEDVSTQLWLFYKSILIKSLSIYTNTFDFIS